MLPACIEVVRARGRGPDMPDELATAYSSGLRQLHECAFRHSDDDWNSDMTQAVAAALAAAKGQIDLAEALTELDRDTIARICAGNS